MPNFSEKMIHNLLNRAVPLEPFRVRVLRKTETVTVELGCGRRKLDSNAIGIDIEEHPGVDIVHDLSKGIPLMDNTVDHIFSRDFIEHLPDSIFIMKEIWRVLKDGSLVELIVPSTDGRGAFQDATHKSYWNENSFGYWCDSSVWADSYRGIALFMDYGVRTVGLNPDGSLTTNSDNPVKHVHALLRAVKDENWTKQYGARWKHQPETSRIIGDGLSVVTFVEAAGL